jgi:hypothetical protein
MERHEARRGASDMIDNFALAVSHGLILLAVWRLVQRPDLDDDAAAERAQPQSKQKPATKGRAGA